MWKDSPNIKLVILNVLRLAMGELTKPSARSLPDSQNIPNTFALMLFHPTTVNMVSFLPLGGSEIAQRQSFAADHQSASRCQHMQARLSELFCRSFHFLVVFVLFPLDPLEPSIVCYGC